jgi:two-component system, chemotaxis family, chemotaxis protein CheY
MKILLVDDSTLARSTLKRILQPEHICLEARGGREALDLYAQEHPELVILDLVMPGMTGFEVLAALRQIDPEARVVIGSADMQSYTRQEALKLGATGYLVKPFNAEDVRRLLDSLQ